MAAYDNDEDDSRPTMSFDPRHGIHFPNVTQFTYAQKDERRNRALECAIIIRYILEHPPAHIEPKEVDYFDGDIGWEHGDRRFMFGILRLSGMLAVHDDGIDHDLDLRLYMYTLLNDENPARNNMVRFIFARYNPSSHRTFNRNRAVFRSYDTYDIIASPEHMMLMAMTRGWSNKWKDVIAHGSPGFGLFLLNDRQLDSVADAIFEALQQYKPREEEQSDTESMNED
jgi:hypothetical protein